MCYVSWENCKMKWCNVQLLRLDFLLIHVTWTHIQPVFDGRVQHGEVCEEDAEVWHGAPGA